MEAAPVWMIGVGVVDFFFGMPDGFWGIMHFSERARGFFRKACIPRSQVLVANHPKVGPTLPSQLREVLAFEWRFVRWFGGCDFADFCVFFLFFS